MLDLNGLAAECLEISKQRLEHDAKIDPDPLKACAGELVEAVEARADYKFFQGKAITNLAQSFIDWKKELYADELMDGIVCLLTACGAAGIEPEAALNKCIEKNRKRALCIGDKL